VSKHDIRLEIAVAEEVLAKCSLDVVDRPPAGRSARVVLLACTLAAGAIAAGTLALSVLRVAAGEVVLAHTEGVNFVSVERLADGGLGALYPPHPERARPYVISPYPPLFYLEWAGVRTALALPDSLAGGRVVSLLALLATTLLLASLIRRTVERRPVALVFSLAALASPFVIESAAIGITDVAALAWSLLGLRFVAGHRSVGLAVVPFALALLTKQSTAAGLVAATAFLLTEGRRRDAFTLFAGSLGLALTAAVGLNALTSGGFAAATVGGLSQPVRWAQLAFLTPYLLRAWIVWPLAALSLAALGGGAGLVGRKRLAFLYAAAAFLLAFATVGKVGSSTNYFLEPVLALSWTAAIGFDRLSRTAPRLATGGLILVAAAALSSGPGLRERSRALAEYRGLIAAAGRELEGLDLRGWILSGSDLFPLIERRGGLPYLNDNYLYGLFWESGRWPTDEFLADIRCGRVRLVLPPAVPARQSGARWGMYWEDWSFWNSPAVVPAIVAAYEAVPGPPDRIVPVFEPRPTSTCPPAAGRRSQPMRPASRNEKYPSAATTM
jgi:hypothetical protein